MTHQGAALLKVIPPALITGTNSLRWELNRIAATTTELIGDIPFHDEEEAQTLSGQQIISFETVEAPVMESVPMPAEPPSSMLTNLEEGRDHSIIDILCREYSFETFFVPTGGSDGEILRTWKPMEIFISQPNVLSKLAGFAFFRATLMIRLEFSTVPTVQGGFVLSYYPDLTPSVLANRTASLLQLTQVPNIQQSFTKSVTVNMEVPFISPFWARNLQTGVGSTGTVFFSRITPSAGDDVAVRAYISAKKDTIHLQYPTTGAVFQTLDERVDTMLDQLRFFYENGKITKEQYQETQNKLTELRNVELPVTQSLRESSAINKKGAISAILSTGSKVAGLASGIPKIGAVASMAAPLLAATSDLAGLLGLSKPPSDKPIKAIRIKPADSHLLSEACIATHQFTVHNEASVSTSDLPFGSTVDEMAVKTIMKTPAIVHRFDVSTSMPTNHVLYQATLNLAQFQRINLERNSILQTHQLWQSSLFNFWNATMKYDFDVYMTQFHRVKLRFVLLPNVFPPNLVGSVLPSSYDLNKATSKIVEFSGDNVNVSLACTPRSNVAVKRTPGTINERANVLIPSFQNFLDQSNSEMTSYGTLLVLVEVPLRNSNNVANNVGFAVSFSAHEAVLAYPRTYLPWLPRTQSDFTLTTDFNKKSRSERMTSPDHLTDDSVEIDNQANLLTSVGDNALHLRNLLNANTRFVETQNLEPGDLMRVNPFITRSQVDSGSSLDLMDYLRCAFAFFKGGINLRTTFLGNPGRGVVCNVAMDNPYAPYFPGVVGNTVGVSITQPQFMTLKAGVREIPIVGAEAVSDFTIPYYQNFHMVQNERSNVYTYGEIIPNILNFIPRTDLRMDLYRSAGDDFRMGFLMALPEMVLATRGAV